MADEVAPWDAAAQAQQKPKREYKPRKPPPELPPWELHRLDAIGKGQTPPPAPNAAPVAAPPGAAAPPPVSATGGGAQAPVYHPSTLQSAALGALNIPFADRAASGIRSMMGKGSYEENLKNYKAMEAAGQKEHPWATLGGSLASSLAGPGGAFRLGAGPAASAAGGALTGMAWGGAQGASDAPDLTNYKQAVGSALRGSAVGGVTGGLLGRAVAGAGKKSDLVPHADVPVAPPKGLSGAKTPPFLANRTYAGIGGNAAEGAQEAAQRSTLQNVFGSAFSAYGGKAGKRAETILNEEQGVANWTVAGMRQSVEPYAREMYQHSPIDKEEFINAFQTGRPLDASRFSPKMQDLSDVMHKHTKDMEKALSDLPDEMRPAFVKNYLAQMWKDPNAAFEKLYGGGRNPSGGFTKQRTFATYRDGIAAGLEPVSDDPIGIFMSSMSNSSQWLAKKQAFVAGKESGDILAKPVGSAIPAGFKKLEGLGDEFNMYVAPKGWAEPWNNHYSSGLRANEAVGDIYDKYMQASNASKAFTLGMSAFHTLTVGSETNFSLLGQGFGELSRAITGSTGGNRLQVAAHGVKTMAKAYTSPLYGAIPESVLKKLHLPSSLGQKTIDTYTRKLAKSDPITEKIVDAATRSGANIKPTSRELMIERGGGGVENLGSSFKHGGAAKVKADLRKDWDIDKINANAKKAWNDPTIKKMVDFGLQGVLSGAKGVTGNALRAMHTLSAPIFEHYVPKMKALAYHSKMEGWLMENPTANPQEIQQAAGKFWHDVDDRMGLMMRDRLFWNNSVNDMLQVMMLSPTWNTGTAHAFIGAIPELEHKLAGDKRMLASGAEAAGLNSKLEYLSGFAVGTLVMGNLYEYFMGGNKPIPGTPQNSPRDSNPFSAALHPRTGGTMPETKYSPKLPEQAIIPGYGKEIISMGHVLKGLAAGDVDPAQKYASGKMNPLTKALIEAAGATDWKGQTTNPEAGDPQGGLGAYAEQFTKRVAEAYMPIVTQNWMQAKQNPGSNLGGVQRFLGLRAAGKQEYDPQGSEGAAQYRRTRAMGEQMRKQIKDLKAQGSDVAARELQMKLKVKERDQRRATKGAKSSYGPLVPEKGYGGPQ